MHTPGPWVAVVNEDPDDEQSYVCAGETVISSAGAYLGTTQDNANMILISAAPDLLAACEAALNDIMETWGATISGSRTVLVDASTVERLKAAIAKANGGAP